MDGRSIEGFIHLGSFVGAAVAILLGAAVVAVAFLS
jgi:hypothetical protein